MKQKPYLYEISASTASKKFFDMLEDTVDDFRSSGTVDDNERAQLIATLLNGQARKYMTDARSIWPLVVSKLNTMVAETPSTEPYEGMGEPVQTTPTDLEVPTASFGNSFSSPSTTKPFWTEGENVRTSLKPNKLSEAAGVEFYTDNDGKIRARVGSSDMSLQDFGKKAQDPRNADIQTLVKGIIKKADAEDYIKDPGDLINIYSKEKDKVPDIAVRGEGSGIKYTYDEDELDAEFERRKASADIASVVSDFS